MSGIPIFFPTAPDRNPPDKLLQSNAAWSFPRVEILAVLLPSRAGLGASRLARPLDGFLAGVALEPTSP